MTDTEIGLLALAAAVWLLVGVVALLAGRFRRDEVFADVTPGLLPDDPGTARRVRVRGTEWDGEMAVAFAPPAGVRPGQAGTVVDGRVDAHDLTATLVDLAVRGHLRVTAVPADRAPSAARARWGRRAEASEPALVDWVVARTDTVPADDRLAESERNLLQGLLAGRDEVRLSQLDDRALRALREAQRDLYRNAVDRSWYRRHPQQRGAGRWGCLPLLLLVALAAACPLVSPTAVGVGAGVAVLAAAIVLGLFVRGRSPRTAEGTAARIQALGFRSYLATAEADQFAFEEAAGIFSRYLPWAMAFGVADHWARVFGDLARRAEAAGAPPITFDVSWFDVSVAFDLADAVGEMAWLADADLGPLSEGLSAVDADVFTGLGDLVAGTQDFMGSLDFLDPLASGCGDGCGDVGCLDL